MRTVVFFCIAAVAIGCSRTPDAVDRLVTRLSASRGLWQNGRSPSINLPETATTEQLLAQVFQLTGFDEGTVTTYKIRRIRKVRIPYSVPEFYTAVLVDTNLGRRIVLLGRYSNPTLGWWSRVYDAETKD